MGWMPAIGRFLAASLRGVVPACVAPARCRVCRAALLDHRNPWLCADCAGATPWIGDGACPGCGYPAGPHAAHRRPCRRCRSGWMGLRGSVAVARYRGGGKALVTSFKYFGEEALAGPLAGLMAARYREAAFCGKADLVVPVPLHPDRRRERGYDQAGLLAAGVAAAGGLELADEALCRVRPTPPQATLGRAARLANLEGAFEAEEEAVAGRRVLLVDDVMTTGATMASCAWALRQAGAAGVYGLVFAR